MLYPFEVTVIKEEVAYVTELAVEVNNPSDDRLETE